MRRDGDVKAAWSLIVDAYQLWHSSSGVETNFEVTKTLFSPIFVSFVCFYFQFYASVLQLSAILVYLSS